MATKWRKYYGVKGLEVTEAGGVRRYYDNNWTYTGKSFYPHSLQHKTDENGNKYVITRDHGKLMVDELVATCYWGRPRDGKVFIIHKDKNKSHCWKDNLMWATPYEYGEHYKDDPMINTSDGYRLVDVTEQSGKIYVSKEGKVKIEGNEAKICVESYDSDVDYERPTQPHVNVYRKEMYAHAEYIEDLVTKAFLPKPKDMENPKILHKNNNYMDCSLENLEWVPFSDERYQAYIAIRTQELDAIDKANREKAIKEKDYWREHFSRKA